MEFSYDRNTKETYSLFDKEEFICYLPVNEDGAIEIVEKLNNFLGHNKYYNIVVLENHINIAIFNKTYDIIKDLNIHFKDYK